MVILRNLILSLLFIFFTGCTSVQTETRFVWLGEYVEFPLVWPSSDMPRYRYLGDLIGEQNFQSNYVEQSRMSRFWQWLIGEADKVPLQLSRPQGIAVDKQGRIYVADVGVKAILVFDIHANKFSYWGNVDGRRFISPVGISIKDDHLLVADSEAGCIWVLNRYTGLLLAKHEYPEIKQPVGIVWAPDLQQFFVTSLQSDKIYQLNDAYNFSGVFSEQYSELAVINRPTYMAYQDGKLLLSDTLGAKIYVIDLNSKHVLSFGKRGDYIGNLTRPKGVAFDSGGRIYVVESYFDHLLIYNAQGQLLLPIGGSGAEPGNFMLPTSVIVDEQQKVYVADMLNSRVSVFQYLGRE